MTSKNDVESYEEDIVVKMEELIMKNDMEYKLTMRGRKKHIKNSSPYERQL